MQLNIPDALLARVQALCEKRDFDVEEFIIDAIAEKLARAHEERRKKSRL